MIFSGIPDLRLRKRQVKHVLKARSGIAYSSFTSRSTNQSKITLHCKSRPTPHAPSSQGEFSASCSSKVSTHIKITIHQWSTKCL